MAKKIVRKQQQLEQFEKHLKIWQKLHDDMYFCHWDIAETQVKRNLLSSIERKLSNKIIGIELIIDHLNIDN